MWFLVESLRRSEAFIIDSCAWYDPTSLSRLMVLGSTFPEKTYWILFFLSYAERSAFTVFMWTGIFFSSLLIWGMGAIIPQIRNDEELCTNRTESRACEEAAIIGFVATYYLVNWSRRTNRSGRDTVLSTMFLLAYVVCGTYSQIYLRLFTSLEVFAGTAIGVSMSLLLSLWIYTVFVPNINHPFSQIMLKYGRMNRSGLRYQSGTQFNK